MCTGNKKCETCKKKEQDKEMKLLESLLLTEFINLDNPAEVQKEKQHYAIVKDMDEPRPRMAPKPKTDGLPTKSFGAKYAGLYLQDEASYVFIDKYGFTKGYKAWIGAIDFSAGAMFAASAQIANEKYVMCRDIDKWTGSDLLDSFGRDYFFRSYFDIWKQWKALLQSKMKKESISFIDKILLEADRDDNDEFDYEGEEYETDTEGFYKYIVSEYKKTRKPVYCSEDLLMDFNMYIEDLEEMVKDGYFLDKDGYLTPLKKKIRESKVILRPLVYINSALPETGTKLRIITSQMTIQKISVDWKAFGSPKKIVYKIVPVNKETVWEVLGNKSLAFRPNMNSKKKIYERNFVLKYISGPQPDYLNSDGTINCPYLQNKGVHYNLLTDK